MSQMTDARLPLDPTQSDLLDELIALPDSGACEFLQKIGGQFVNSPLGACVGAFGDKVTFESGPTTISSNADSYGPFVGSKAAGAAVDVEGVFAVNCTVTAVRVFVASNSLTTGEIEIILVKNGVDIATIATITSGVTGLLTTTGLSETFLSSDGVYYRFATATGGVGQTIEASISTEVEYSTATPLADALPVNGLEFIGADWGIGGQLIQATTIDGNGKDFSITNADTLAFSGVVFNANADTVTITGDNILTLEAVTSLRFYTAAVDAGTATAGQAPLLVDPVTGEVEFGDVVGGAGDGTKVFVTTTQAFASSVLTAYSSYFGSASTTAPPSFNTTEASVLGKFSEEVTVTRMRVFKLDQTGTPTDVVLTLRKNGVDTSTVITTTAGVNGYFTVTSSEQFLSTDDVSIKVTRPGSAVSGSTYIAICIEAVPTAVPVPDTINYSTVTVTATEIRDCFNTPINLIGAPGAGKAIQVLGITLKKIYTTPLVFSGGSGTYQIQISQVATPTISPTITSNILLFSSSTPSGQFLGITSSITQQTNVVFPYVDENVPVILSGYTSTGTIPTSATGGDDVTVYLTYRIITL
jgi:hypothetical protein